VAPRFKNLLRLEAGYPALRCHNLEEEHLPPQRLEKIPSGFGLVGINYYPRPKYFFCSRQKASNQQAASDRRAVKEDELHAELEQQGQRDGAARAQPPAAAGSWRTSGARSSSSGSLTWRCTWHSASSRTCTKIRQRRQHQGQARQAPGQRARGRRQGGPTARPGPYGCVALLLPRQPQHQ